MFCGNCGTQLTEGAAFCGECGAKVGAAIPPAEAAPYSQPVYYRPAPQYQPSMPQYQPSGAGGENQKKKKVPVIIALTAAGIAAVILIAVVVNSVNSAGEAAPTLLGTWKFTGINRDDENLQLLQIVLLLAGAGVDVESTSDIVESILKTAGFSATFTGDQITFECPPGSLGSLAANQLFKTDFRFVTAYYTENNSLTIVFDQRLIEQWSLEGIIGQGIPVEFSLTKKQLALGPLLFER